MQIDEKILSRFDELIRMGEQVLTTRRSRSTATVSYMGDFAVDSQLSHQWGVSCLNILKRVLGSNSDHYVKFDQLFVKFHDFQPTKKALGILKSAKEEYQNDLLFDTRVLIEAEVFDDFLGQAQHLFESGYFQASAVIAGSVLEDGLRKLCTQAKVLLSDKPKLDVMNSELAKAGVYNKLVQKRITALADLRNKAAHGQWNEFSSSDVDDMLRQVRVFMENYFS
ncbi:DUF4145 domain-containing protein [Leptolyngbya sp. PCC 6406]|uniref:DUF4145 domain-containing protein n=1 Tax=Leptolyngbya sp. PCC 6406 TaxID=1173264 RepID=UPI0002AC02EC|nr:DUF4145 domain-containing protein [Leptolyngbya sp. PCC 6406]